MTKVKSGMNFCPFCYLESFRWITCDYFLTPPKCQGTIDRFRYRRCRRSAIVRSSRCGGLRRRIARPHLGNGPDETLYTLSSFDLVDSSLHRCVSCSYEPDLGWLGAGLVPSTVNEDLCLEVVEEISVDRRTHALRKGVPPWVVVLIVRVVLLVRGAGPHRAHVA